jgi:hypothetical protein
VVIIMYLATKILLTLVFCSIGFLAHAAPVGHTVAASTRVTSSGPGGRRVIKANSPIYSDDRLKANATGNAQILLIDKTKIVIGPGADLRIDDFVYNSKKSFSKLVIRSSKGAFRFISGKSKSSAYKIITPTATIGVRGTAFDVTVKREGSYIALLKGKLRVCDRKGQCKNIKQSCTYVLVGKRGIKRTKLLVGSKNRKVGNLFPLLANQGPLKRGFRQRPRDCSSAAIDHTARSVVAAKSVPAVAAQPRSRASVSPDPERGEPATPAPDIADPAPDPGTPGNPGNGRSVGNAGPAPGPGNFGGNTNGRGDVNNNGENGRGNGNNGANNGNGGRGNGNNGSGGR